MKVSNTLQQLVMGDRNLFVVQPRVSALNDLAINVTPAQVAKVLTKLDRNNYEVSNANVLMHFTENELSDFKDDFNAYRDSNVKEGMVFRTSFFDTPEPVPATKEEEQAIFAQYAMTYGWEDQYNTFAPSSAQEVLATYTKKFSKESIDLSDSASKVTFKLINLAQFERNVLIPILESRSVLRNHQIQILKNTPTSVLADATKASKITIKETLVMLMRLLKDEPLDFALLKSATDILRYIVSTYAYTPVEGQLNKTILKDCKIRIPTSARKQILNNLELLGAQRGSKFLCEDMFAYDAYWKIINTYLQYEAHDKCRTKYPYYTSAIDLLYINDRSWTFNGRYSKAKEAMDYATAISIAAERPGFLLRNLMEFMRMAKGVLAPTKIRPVSYNRTLVNTVMNTCKSIALTDASAFFTSDKFREILSAKLNTKLAFQLLEQINSPSNWVPIYNRVVQGVTIKYEIPVPALDEHITNIVKTKLEEFIALKLQTQNSVVGNVFIDPSANNYALQYSGRSSTELSYNGEFLSKNSKIPFSDINANNTIVRLGVMWRSKEGNTLSLDIDHNAIFMDSKNNEVGIVYYGSPALKIGSLTVAVSSGDITSNGGQDALFSTEIIDIDLAKLKGTNITKFYNSFINYHGGNSIGDVECYTFMQMRDKSQLPLGKGLNITHINLAETDYAIRIDSENIDKTGSYIGLSFDMEKEQIEVLAIPRTNKGAYSNAKTRATEFNKIINDQTPPLTLEFALSKAFTEEQIVTNVEEADLIISRRDISNDTIKNTAVVLHPGRDMEQVNEFIF